MNYACVVFSAKASVYNIHVTFQPTHVYNICVMFQPTHVYNICVTFQPTLVCTRATITTRARHGRTDATTSVPVWMAQLDSTNVKHCKYTTNMSLTTLGAFNYISRGLFHICDVICKKPALWRNKQCPPRSAVFTRF